jgi:hypothetical protein
MQGGKEHKAVCSTHFGTGSDAFSLMFTMRQQASNTCCPPARNGRSLLRGGANIQALEYANSSSSQAIHKYCCRGDPPGNSGKRQRLAEESTPGSLKTVSLSGTVGGVASRSLMRSRTISSLSSRTCPHFCARSIRVRVACDEGRGTSWPDKKEAFGDAIASA